jgi:hypothetical protein
LARKAFATTLSNRQYRQYEPLKLKLECSWLAGDWQLFFVFYIYIYIINYILSTSKAFNTHGVSWSSSNDVKMSHQKEEQTVEWDCFD